MVQDVQGFWCIILHQRYTYQESVFDVSFSSQQWRKDCEAKQSIVKEVIVDNQVKILGMSSLWED